MVSSMGTLIPHQFKMRDIAIILLILSFSLTEGKFIEADPTVMKIESLGYLRGKQVQTMGFSKSNGPRNYHHYKNIKFGEARRFKVTIDYDCIG